MVSWVEHFKAMTVADYIKTIKPVALVSCHDDDPVVGALQKLAEHSILSMPVADASGRFHAFLDIVDIVAVSARLFEEKAGLGNFYATAANDAELSQRKVREVVGRSNRNPFCPVSPTDSMLDVIKVLANRGVHRVPVLENGTVTAVITQSNVVNYVDTHRAAATGGALDQTIGALGLGHRDVVTVYHDTRALQAFRMMDFARVSGVAVLEEDGSLLSVLSAKDLRLVASAESNRVNFEDLLLTAREFITKAHEPEHIGRKVKLEDSITLHPLASACHESATLGRVIHKLHASKTHRIFVVDNMSKPTGCIALRDVLLALIK
eukprot:TRINITY_DN1320_c1_g1_i2.p2 TRINITY_DN1320_c1_g1~~TRINITY_DN1320_c1_g1_i2.p2  ORF type:complete len:322 (+),score=180.86 TRINITY_DN1320_c1_g1_i2:117-1082(+)